MTPEPPPARAPVPARPRLARVGRAPADVDLHALALALDAPALIERGAAPRESWHVIPLSPQAGAEIHPERGWEWDGRGSRPVPASATPGLDALARLQRLVACAPPEEDLPFACGLVVLLAYGLAHEIERLPRTTQRRDRTPLLHASACPASLLVPVGGGEALLAWLPAQPSGFGWSDAEADAAAARAAASLADPARAAEGREPSGAPAGDVAATWTREDHEAGVAALIEEERAGEIYQANLTQRFEVAWRGSALPLHRHLRRLNPSPFSGWLREPRGEWELVSGSPERLVRRRGDELTSEPIKGTVALPAGAATPDDDVARLAASLVASEKDRAELVMIVDLHRNDLGRVSVPGSVRVEQLLRIDRRSHVLQAIADIRGTAAPGCDAVALVRALFPGGCVTGVPKIRAMELLDSLERFDRGPYTGSFGFVAGWGDLDLNVLIRSAWRSGAPALASGSGRATGSTLAFAAGGGIVLASDPAAEYEESLAKAQALREAIEALRRESARGGTR